VLCFLAGFSLLTEDHVAGRATVAERAMRVSQLYGDARFWVGQEESLERKYRLEPTRAVLHLHDASMKNLTGALKAVGAIDRSPPTARLIARLLREQGQYAAATALMFDAVDAHNTPLATDYDHASVDPIFGQIETAVYARRDLAAQQALRESHLLRVGTVSARTAITIAFAIGIALLGAFASILLGLRRRVSAAHEVEIERLASAALTDSLTGLRNHRAFQEDLARELRRRARVRGRLALIMLDLDGLKAINDTGGHQAGDGRLQALAHTLTEAFRGGDCAYRVGGDEFAVVLADAGTWDALEATQRLQAGLAHQGIHVTAGIADADGPKAVDVIIREADLALIAGKRRRHAATLYSPELQPAAVGPDAARDAEHVNSLTSALALAVDAKDSYTRSHCQTVSELCALIATEIKLGPALIGKMRVAGLLHDVGKIGIPDAILTKPSALTAAEYEQMKRHSILGEEIVAAAGLSAQAQWVRHHHERVDGTGYPDGLAGEDIPLQSRIILTADAFEAMTSDRPYRKAPGRDAAIAELRCCAGTQFDRAIVEALCRVLESPQDPGKDLVGDPRSDGPPAARAETVAA
jgi:diguanylate cyclase (GGDEF)-like protein